ncbi:MAG: hypothetical protein ACTSQJ_19115, partial [Promethearchaeota archaeon]
GKYINLTEILKSAFTDSKLNAAFQKAVVADGTVNWSAIPDSLKANPEITGLDRQNADADTSEWLELMISKKKCSDEEANAILELLLTGIVNESTGEEGFINCYDDNSGHIAVLMNLAKDVLKIVPMKDMGWKNDGQGDRPKEFDEWVKELAEGLLKLITALIAAIGDFIAGLVEAAVEAGLKFIQTIVAAVMALIEAIIKALLLAFIWLMFALALFSAILLFSIIGPIMIGFSYLIGGDGNFGLFYIELNIESNSIRFEKQFKWRYCEPLDIDLPYMEDRKFLNGEIISITKNGITDGFFSEESFEISETSINKPEVNTNAKSISLSTTLDNSIDLDTYGEYYDITIWNIGILLPILLIPVAFLKDPEDRMGGFGFVIIGYTIYYLVSIIATIFGYTGPFSEDKEVNKSSAFLGMAVACGIIALSYIIALIVTYFIRGSPKLLNFWKLISIIGGITATILFIVCLMISEDFTQKWLLDIDLITSLIIPSILIATSHEKQPIGPKEFNSFIFGLSVYSISIGLIGLVLAILGYIYF